MTFQQGAPMTLRYNTEDEAQALLAALQTAMTRGVPGETTVPGDGSVDLTRVTAVALMTPDGA